MSHSGLHPQTILFPVKPTSKRMAKQGKKEKKGVPVFKRRADASGLTPWPDLPQQLIDVISWQYSALTSDISYGGVTKSWRAQTKQCNSQAILPWLQLYDGNLDTKFKFNITFHRGVWNWNVWYSKNWPQQPPWKYHVGCSGGVLVGKGTSPTKYYLHFPPRIGDCYHILPPWDQRIPFGRAVISSSTRDRYRRHSVLMVLTGTSHPAFVFYRKKEGAEYAWIKQDCTIADPHSSNKSERNCFMQFTNAIGYKGKFYALSLQGTLAVIEDIDSQPRITALGSKRAVPFTYSRHFRECLLESDGEILLAFLISRKSVNIVDDLELFRLDISTLSWIKMEKLGDRALFLGSNCCMSVSASKMGCRSNCVYFSHHKDEGWWVYDFQRGNISVCQSDAILPRGLSFRLNEQENE